MTCVLGQTYSRRVNIRPALIQLRILAQIALNTVKEKVKIDFYFRESGNFPQYFLLCC